MLIARIEQTNPAIPTATRNQSYDTRRLTRSATAAASPMAFGALRATAHSSALAGQNQSTVKTSVTSSIAAGTASKARNRQGVVHPAIKLPREQTSKVTELGKKYSPVSTGKRGPYGNRLRDSGGEGQ